MCYMQAKRQEEEERLAREREEKRAAQRKRKLEKRRRQKKQSSNRLEQLFSGRREVWIMPSHDEREGMQHMVEGGGEEGSGHLPGRGGDEGSGVVNPGTGGVGATEPESISVSEVGLLGVEYIHLKYVLHIPYMGPVLNIAFKTFSGFESKLHYTYIVS